ncbi:hypothetical protein Rhopal_006862-T1 [Rhodotorula paludigena]|uniref:choline-phosphate cytidylyltransferase n=1 Tax=Rhodotorula paludigena TaxID=86838 RepID=A0AAV5GTF4_9BASI|nr:hypothetical protein Rhopal_006862-T1 [Rhodotorula paludigena]
MASHGVSTPSGAASTPSKRRLSSRRLVPEGEGESSREASAESNDEPSPSGLEDDDDDDDDVLPSRSADPTAAAIAAGLDGVRLGTPRAGGSGAPPAAAGEGYDSAGHDGDISSATANSSTTAARLATHPHAFRAPVNLPPPHLLHHQTSYRSSASASASGADGEYSPSPSPSASPPLTETETDGDAAAAARAGAGGGQSGWGDRRGEVMWAPAPSGFLSNLTAEEIQEHIRNAIAGHQGRQYKIKQPPTDRPVRIYADGVYDLLHYGHMLQLRQCKLAFPSVHLLVGVCSSSLVRAHKANPVLSSQERYESVRHLRWVDEVVEDAPWNVDQAFIDKWQIDYVAHDEEPYASAGQEDVYAYAKSIGAFLPTKRTNGVSTSELLQRIVEGYREGDYDSKLRKIGHPELCSRQGSVAGSATGAPPTISRRDSNAQ